MGLSVVYAADTGHVVGALALTGALGPAVAGPAAAPPDPAAFVGRALPLRVSLDNGEVAALPLGVRELAAAAVDDEPAALAEPLAFGVELSPDGRPKPALVRLASWTGGISLAADGLVVKVQVASGRPVRVTALVSDDEDTHVLAGEIPAGQLEVKLPLTLAPGRENGHGVLVLAAGWAGRLQKVKLT
ncbi:hypothetical protein [Streptomyces sp. NPDC050504]|uniref:hypothetical protein n=1 Tax=Streptomyces sp. NPDC050504 TaxID=3365618 RepID=UPI00379D25AA